MAPKLFTPMRIDQLGRVGTNSTLAWIWHGYLARGNLTLLTSQWKAGKTTLLAGLLHQFDHGSEFLGRNCAPTHTVVLSEESDQLWERRHQTIPIGQNTRLLTRPFLIRPTPEQWNELIDQAIAWRAAGELDLFVIDPLASFLPGRSESDVNTLLEMLQPLQRLASQGVAVLILHHPRKKTADEGSSARGSGALLGFVDIILELHCWGRLQSDQHRRRLIGLSRFPETPRNLVYQWTSDTGAFSLINDPFQSSYRENWQVVVAILKNRKAAATHQELLMDWPAESSKPGATVLYEWLNRAFLEQLVHRTGTGRRNDPYLYRLPRKDDKDDDRFLGDLPTFGSLWGDS